MPVRIVSVIANCESSPRVKSIAKKRIAHRVGNGNLVIKVIEVIKVIKIIKVILPGFLSSCHHVISTCSRT